MQPGGRRRLLVPVALLAVGALLFALVSLDVAEGGLLARLDPHVAGWSFVHMTGTAHSLLSWITWLGDSQVLEAFVLFGMAWLSYRRRFADAVALGAGAAVAGLLTMAFKDAFRRARPAYVDPNELPHSFSFPSGHTSGAFTAYLLLAVVLTATLSERLRWLAVGCGLGVAAVVAATRVLLPVHYLTDVIAGACLGVAVVGGTLLLRNLAAVRG